MKPPAKPVIKPVNQQSLYISVTITDDETIRNMNKEYLKRDYTTDVLSFNIDENMPDGRYYLGDVVVNKEQAKRQAKDYANTEAQELAALVEHGVLHLLGVHHADDDEHTVHGIQVKPQGANL